MLAILALMYVSFADTIEAKKFTYKPHKYFKNPPVLDKLGV